MANTTSISASGVGDNPVYTGKINNAKALIDRFDNELSRRKSDAKYQPTYAGIDDILINKYHIKDIDKIEAPDFKKTTDFITNNVRGNIQKANGNVLSYDEANFIIFMASHNVMP